MTLIKARINFETFLTHIQEITIMTFQYNLLILYQEEGQKMAYYGIRSIMDDARLHGPD